MRLSTGCLKLWACIELEEAVVSHPSVLVCVSALVLQAVVDQGVASFWSLPLRSPRENVFWILMLWLQCGLDMQYN